MLQANENEWEEVIKYFYSEGYNSVLLCVSSWTKVVFLTRADYIEYICLEGGYSGLFLVWFNACVRVIMISVRCCYSVLPVEVGGAFHCSLN